VLGKILTSAGAAFPVLSVTLVATLSPTLPPRVQSGDYLLHGETDKEMAAKFRAAPLRDGGMVILTSQGGDADSAMDIADVIHPSR
jgi:hypothetical protein